MPRAAKLSRHLGYWYTKAGDPNGVYFGRVDEVPYDEAKKAFRTYLASLRNERRQRRLPNRSVAEICDAHLQWVLRNRSEALFATTKVSTQLMVQTSCWTMER